MKERSPSLFRIAFVFVVLVVVFAAKQETSASAPQKRVLVLYSQDHGLPAHELTDQAIRLTLKANPTFAIQIFSEFLDLSRFEGPRHKAILGRYLADKYADTMPDLIITVDPGSLDFILNYADPTFPGIPIVACTIFESEARKLEKSGLRQEVTGGFLKEDIGDLLPLIHTLKRGPGASPWWVARRKRTSTFLP